MAGTGREARFDDVLRAAAAASPSFEPPTGCNLPPLFVSLIHPNFLWLSVTVRFAAVFN